MEFQTVALGDPLAQAVVEGLRAEYLERYGSGDELDTTSADQFAPPEGTFVVLVDSSGTVAGAGLRRHDERSCELKRMWTRPDRRREGLAARVLSKLESEAVALGYSRLVLETGPAQPEAKAFYENHGYSRVPFYGRYPQALAFEKELI